MSLQQHIKDLNEVRRVKEEKARNVYRMRMYKQKRILLLEHEYFMDCRLRGEVA